jgi:hypothetical protein
MPSGAVERKSGSPRAHRVVGPGTHRDSRPREVHTTDPCAYLTITSHPDEIPAVCEYHDVFLTELLGMPPDQDVEFVIEL